MTEKIVPENVKIAAKRGFIRTTSQALAGTLATGITATTVLAFVQEFDPVVSSIVLGAALVSPLIAGGASYFDILAKGIPEDYQA